MPADTLIAPAPPRAAGTSNPLENRTRVIPYPAIQQHGLIGDRRTAALVASDGTLDWLCLPDFDGSIVFGALLDWAKGGYWRLGPARMTIGQQAYLDGSMVLETRWDLPGGALLLQDVMLWPQNERPPEQADLRVIVRSLRCLGGTVECELDLRAGCNFQQEAIGVEEYSSGFRLQTGDLPLRFWSNHLPMIRDGRLHTTFELKEGEELWTVLELGAAGHGWSVDAARGAVEQTQKYWQDWVGALSATSEQDKDIRRSAMAVHLLTHAAQGSVVAAPTTSLPERPGGGWNADYRLCWVRDASLSVGMLAHLGNLKETEQYLAWLLGRLSRFGQPLQVLYGIHGEKRPKQHKLSDVSGYRDSQPVRIGNHAYKQRQLGSLGYLADCLWIFLQAGGQWREEYWAMLRRLANYTVSHWEQAENGLWELPEPRHFVSSKVLCWVMLDRAIQIAQKVKPAFDLAEWRNTRAAIHAEVMDKGWSEAMGAFRQHYEADNLDSSVLLISVMEFLPADHPRVLSTVDRIIEFLSIDDWVFRFDPLQTPGLGQFPLGQLEGAFFPSTFWLATVCARAGQIERAEKLLQRAEDMAGPLGLFSEACDPRTNSFLGNTPLLFSHVEYVRAKLELARARSGQNA